MKHLSAILLALFLFTALSACSEDPPSVRVRNDRDTKVNVQLQPAAGSTKNINDVAAGETSAFIDVDEGVWTAKASIQSESQTPEETFQANNDVNYTVVIVNTDPPVVQVISEEK